MISSIIKLFTSGEISLSTMFAMLLGFVVALYFAIVLHEVAHGLVAHWNGDDTARINGRLTLNPIKHIDPVGAVMMLVVGIGWAKPVPVDSRNYRNRRRGMVTVALAGVTANLIMAVLALAGVAALGAIVRNVNPYTVTSFGVFMIEFTEYLLVYGAMLNISLMAFNLLPIAPLDGFRLVESFTRPNNGYVRFMYRYGRYIFLLLILLGVLANATGWPCDILGMYINAVYTGIIKLFNLIIGA